MGCPQDSQSTSYPLPLTLVSTGDHFFYTIVSCSTFATQWAMFEPLAAGFQPIPHSASCTAGWLGQGPTSSCLLQWVSGFVSFPRTARVHRAALASPQASSILDPVMARFRVSRPAQPRDYAPYRVRAGP